MMMMMMMLMMMMMMAKKDANRWCELEVICFSSYHMINDVLIRHIVINQLTVFVRRLRKTFLCTLIVLALIILCCSLAYQIRLCLSSSLRKQSDS